MKAETQISMRGAEGKLNVDFIFRRLRSYAKILRIRKT